MNSYRILIENICICGEDCKGVRINTVCYLVTVNEDCTQQKMLNFISFDSLDFFAGMHCLLMLLFCVGTVLSLGRNVFLCLYSRCAFSH